MNIGQTAQHTGLPVKTIRYYEEIGLVAPERRANGYRYFRARDLHSLAFVARAQALGFGIDDCRTLLQLYQDKSRSSAQVKDVAQQHLAKIEQKISDLAEMRATLASLVHSCAGDERPDCPILASLSVKAPKAQG